MWCCGFVKDGWSVVVVGSRFVEVVSVGLWVFGGWLECGGGWLWVCGGGEYGFVGLL